MQNFKNVFGRIWAVWAILMFVSTMLIFLVPFFIFSYFAPEPKKTYRFISYSRIWMAVFLTSIGCPLRVRGRENFQKNENYIVLCNHNSLMDIPVSSPAIPGGNKTIAKQEMSKVPLFGYLYTTGSVLVDRKSDQSRKDSYQKMKRVLKMGLHMCIYPEGTRNKTKQPLKEFHNGAFRLAMETGKSIIPGVIFNTAKVLPANKSFYVEPHRLRIDFLPPIPVSEGDTADLLKNRVYSIMEEYYVSNK